MNVVRPWLGMPCADNMDEETSATMPALTETAAIILSRMEPGRSYQPTDLRAFVPDASNETLRELMHELWVHRRVERSGYSGWRIHRSASGQREDAGGLAAARTDTNLRPPTTKAVKPEDLFDHDTFSGFFR